MLNPITYISLIGAIIPFLPLVIYFCELLIINILPINKEYDSYVNEITNNCCENVSVIIPTFNEERIIKKKILSVANLEHRGNIEIIVVDESTDNTTSIIADLKKEMKNIKYVRPKKRAGYNQSILLGIRNSQYDYILLTDSHSLLDKFSLKKALHLMLNDSKIGLVSGQGILLNKEDRTSRFELFYIKLNTFLRFNETKAGTCFLARGEFILYRKAAIKDFKEVRGCFDTESSLHSIKKGFKTIFLDMNLFYEYYPQNIQERYFQKKIRAINLIMGLLPYKSFLFNFRYGFFGLSTFPFYFYSLIVFPFLLIVSFISSLVFILSLMIFSSYLYSFILLGVLAIISIVKPIRIAIFSLLQILLSLIDANISIFFKKQKSIVFIPKIDSTRK